MAKSENQKRKLLALKRVFEQSTDESHSITMQEILKRLEALGIQSERKSVYSDIECLTEDGMDIVWQRRRPGGYYLASRLFELPELKLLVDAVQSSKFLSQRKSLELIGKLEQLASNYEAVQLRRQVVVSGRIKTMNESIYYNVDRIHDAISRNSQISFRYFDWGVDRQKHYRPGPYVASPYALCWADENYYLIAHSQRHGITHYRVDKMASIALTGEPRAVTEETRSLNLADYSKAVFSMFSGSVQQVRMRFDNTLAGVVIDRFGRDSLLVPDGASHFIFTADIAVSPTFLSWIIGFGAKARILSPESVADQCRALLEETLRQYCPGED